MPCVGIARTRWIQVFVSVVASLLIAGTAAGQVKDVATGYVVVTKDKADLRCGETTNYYKVMELAAGTVLTLDGEATDYARVGYPAGATALIKAEDVRYDEATKTATVTQPSKLRAANVLTGALDSSWKSLLAQPLAAGTTLKVSESVKDAEGRVVAYRVPAPAAARGFVRRADVRQATPAEIEAARGKQAPLAEAPRPGNTDKVGAPAPGPTNVKDPPQQVAPTPKPQEGVEKPAENQGTPPAPSPAPGDNSLVEPMVKPGETPPPAPATEPTTPPATGPTTAPAANDTAAPPTAEPAQPKAPTLQELERAFEKVRKENSDEAEYQALIGEFRRLQSSQPEKSRLHKQIQGRIDWMEMKLEIRERQRQVEDMKRQADSQGRDVTTKLAELERQRQYAIVGRLLPSNIYDGTNLPLMYRLQSVTGGMSPRTVGYIKPSPELDLPTKLNQVVGVIGEIKMDPGMTLNMITAQRVDILQSSDGGPIRNP